MRVQCLRVLVFDIWGDYAHFRKYYTTTSPLTFSIPPRTAVCGLIGAILGLDKDDYLEKLSKKDAFIAVRALNKIRKIRFSENLIDTKKAGRHMNEITTRTQIRFEFLRDPRFRIYFSHQKKDLMDEFKELISQHKSIYTPCLGLSEHLADFAYIGEFEGEEQVAKESIYLESVVPESTILKLEFEQGKEYITEMMPVEMAADRTVKEYSSILFERNAHPIKAVVKNYVRLDNDGKIVFL